MALCNLECPISGKGKPLKKQYVFRASTDIITGIEHSGFNIFSVANNHALDYGYTAFLDTVNILKSKKLFVIGSGKNQVEAHKPVIITKNGLSFAFLAYNVFPWYSIKYDETAPGPAKAEIEKIKVDVYEAKKTADLVIISFHWGYEDTYYPIKQQKKFAYTAIDTGADLIIGHHPHVIQSMEYYKTKLIVYSLGNFVFDQKSRHGKESMVFGCSFTKTGVLDPYIIPVLITGCRPEFAKDNDKTVILNNIKKYSKKSNVFFVDKPDVVLLNMK